MKEKLKEIWESEYFKVGNRYFWLFNYNFFGILNEADYMNLNSKSIHNDKHIFAVADAGSPDKEHEAYLYYDILTNEIFIQSNFPHIEPKRLRKISDNISELLLETDFSEIFITQDDMKFRTWFESIFHSYEYENIEIPKGVLPDFHLEKYFKNNINGTFLSDHKQFNTKEFVQYFQSFGINSIDESVFGENYPNFDRVNDVVLNINNEISKDIFKMVSFNPSAYFGVVNLNILDSEIKQQLIKFGLLNE